MYSSSVNDFRSTFEDRRMLKTLVEVTGDTLCNASRLCPTVVKCSVVSEHC